LKVVQPQGQVSTPIRAIESLGGCELAEAQRNQLAFGHVLEKKEMMSHWSSRRSMSVNAISFAVTVESTGGSDHVFQEDWI
jgi:hypothetical protein